MKKTGFTVIDNIPWGTHVCQFHNGKQDLIDVAGGFFEQGLLNNERCVWLVSDVLGVSGAEAALRETLPNMAERLRSGQMTIEDAGKWYNSDAESIIQDLLDLEQRALESGYDGLRISGAGFPEGVEWHVVSGYERAANEAIRKARIKALCVYEAGKLSTAEMLDLAGSHHLFLLKENDIWQVVRNAEAPHKRNASLMSGLLDSSMKGASRKEYLEAVVESVQRWSGCRCVGIRVLDTEGNVPYEAYTGFSREFWELENWLSLKRDICLCTRVMSEKPDAQDLPVLTPKGSFCCGNAARFVSELTPQEQKRFRGNCIKNGFASIAVIPIRFGGNISSAIHLADEREGMVPEEKVEFIESVSPLIGEAVHRFSVEDELRKNYQLLWEHGERLESLIGERTAELREANQRLQDEVAERRQAETKLRATAAELERSNRDLERFAYLASHDLQEPLRSVVGHLQILEKRYRDSLDQEAREFIDFAVDGALRMKNLIVDLLGYSRLETRGTPPRPTDAGAVLQNVLAALRQIISTSGAQITYESLPIVRADERQLHQALRHLVANGIKFRHRDRTPRIHISAEQREDEVVFAVSDNGMGIEPQHQTRIFEVFQQLHARGKYQGTGIGLAACKKIAERHGGRIWVESEIGQGSTFYFSLPS